MLIFFEMCDTWKCILCCFCLELWWSFCFEFLEGFFGIFCYFNLDFVGFLCITSSCLFLGPGGMDFKYKLNRFTQKFCGIQNLLWGGWLGIIWGWVAMGTRGLLSAKIWVIKVILWVNENFELNEYNKNQKYSHIDKPHKLPICISIPQNNYINSLPRMVIPFITYLWNFHKFASPESQFPISYICLNLFVYIYNNINVVSFDPNSFEDILWPQKSISTLLYTSEE